MEIISIIVSGMVAGWTGFVFRKITRRLKTAEAQRVEIDNDILVATEWKKIAEQREEKIARKDEKIDRLYLDLGSWRDKYNNPTIEHNILGIENAKMIARICNRRSCPEREPQSGF